MNRGLVTRLEALERHQGSASRQIIVWRSDDEAEYQVRLAEAQSQCGPLESVLVVGWLPPQDAPYSGQALQ